MGAWTMYTFGVWTIYRLVVRKEIKLYNGSKIFDGVNQEHGKRKIQEIRIFEIILFYVNCKQRYDLILSFD